MAENNHKQEPRITDHCFEEKYGILTSDFLYAITAKIEPDTTNPFSLDICKRKRGASPTPAPELFRIFEQDRELRCVTDMGIKTQNNLSDKLNQDPEFFPAMRTLRFSPQLQEYVTTYINKLEHSNLQ